MLTEILDRIYTLICRTCINEGQVARAGDTISYYQGQRHAHVDIYRMLLGYGVFRWEDEAALLDFADFLLSAEERGCFPWGPNIAPVPLAA